MERGFILQPTYRIEAGRPVVQIWGKLESGATFLIRDDRPVPHFAILRKDVGRARKLGATVREEVPPRHTMHGQPVARVEVPTPPDAPPLRDRLMAAGITCFEADVRFAYRYLIDRSIRGSLEIRGEARRQQNGLMVFNNPDVRPAEWSPRLSLLSFDIETDPDARSLLAIALAGCGASEVLLLTPPGSSCPDSAVAQADLRSHGYGL